MRRWWLPALAALIAGNFAGASRKVAYAVIGGVSGAGIAVGPILRAISPRCLAPPRRIVGISLVCPQWGDGGQCIIPAHERRPRICTGAGELPLAFTALVLVILPQVLVPASLREGPPLLVPVIEGCVALILLAVAAKPGPVPRGARPLILTLFAVLIVANTAAAVRLVTVVLRGAPTGEAPPTVTQLLVGAGIVLATNVVTFGLLYWQIDGGGP